MEIILLENITKLGKIGEVVEVKDGYARNFLLSQGKALRSNKKNLEIVSKKKEELNKKDNEIKKQFIKISEKINKKSIKVKKETIDQMCSTRAPFLFNNYYNIYNRLVKGELNLEILGRLIMLLKGIEDGKYDQHEASVAVGQLLKEMYIDSALRGETKKKSGKVERKRKGNSYMRTQL